MVEETGENHRPVQVTDKLYHIMLHTSPSGPLREGVRRGGAPGHMSLGGTQAKRGKKRECTLNKANKIKCEYVNDNFV